MKFIRRNDIRAAVLVAVAMLSLSCTNEFVDSTSPVLLVLSNTQQIDTIDLLPGAGGCDTSIGTVRIQAILKNPSNVDQRFNDVRIDRYRVSYRRTDGGTLVPASFVLSQDLLIAAGGAASNLGTFRVFQREAINQAPFAALLPQNGGRDPETGRRTVSMDVVLEVFGETIAGSNVSGSTRFPLTFCYDCGGCG
ncbi:MAG TPA: hypothetical protein VMS98_02590 [Thermoanaerobaculia bacterium]|nr:hypothetical protein [Thermoanaerobaculia bacterium]